MLVFEAVRESRWVLKDQMAIEVEKKYRLADADVEHFRSRLRDAGAECRGLDEEENVIYGGGVLDEKGAVLRVRNVRGRTQLTYKRRIGDIGGAKRQIEHEVVLNDRGPIDELLGELGFFRRLVYEKRRETWSFREVELVIDELPFGRYLEAEGSLVGIKEAEVLLGLDEFERVDETYPQLTTRFGSQIGGVIECRF
jgi:adenylate cyclase class 2